MAFASSNRLRPDVELIALNRSHADTLLQWVQDPYVAQNICMRAAPTLERTLAWIDRAATDPTLFARGIRFSQKYVGNVILDRIDDLSQTARFSIYLGESTARGTGVGSSAGFLALKHGFEKLGLRKIYLHVHVGNSRAIKSYRALGFVEEGTLRKELFYQGVWTNALVMSVLREEFTS